MTLGEMLHELRENVLHDRSDRIDGDDDRLWSDATLIRYLDEAQFRFARRTGCLRTGGSSLTQVTTVAYQDEYPLDPSVIAVISAKFMGNGTWTNGVYTLNNPPNAAGTALIHPDKADLARAGHFQFEGYQVPDRYYFNPSELSRLTPGKPLAYATDDHTTADSAGSLGVMNMRLYPQVSPEFAGCVVAYRALKVPTSHFNAESLSVVSEIPAQYHFDLLDYAAYLALRIVDHELGDPERAQEFLASFNGKVTDAKNEMIRKMFTPQAWGFGRNGYSYTSN